MPGTVKRYCTAQENGGEIALTKTEAGEHPFVGYTGSNQPYDVQVGRIFAIPKGATKIYFLSENNVFSYSGNRLISFYDKDKNIIKFFAIPDGGAVIPSNAKYFCMRIGIGDNTGAVGTVYKDRVSVSFDQQAEWQPPFYKEVEKSVTLRSLPDGTHDEYRNGKIIRRVGCMILNGTETQWGKIDMTNSFGFQLSHVTSVGDSPSGAMPNILCSHFEQRTPDSVWTSGAEGITTRSTIIRLQFADQTTIDTVDKLKNWLAEHPVTVLYKLAEPEEEIMSFPILPTQAPYAQVYTDSPVDTDIEFEILTRSDYASDIADIKERLAALESAALN